MVLAFIDFINLRFRNIFFIMVIGHLMSLEATWCRLRPLDGARDWWKIPYICDMSIPGHLNHQKRQKRVPVRARFHLYLHHEASTIKIITNIIVSVEKLTKWWELTCKTVKCSRTLSIFARSGLRSRSRSMKPVPYRHKGVFTSNL